MAQKDIGKTTSWLICVIYKPANPLDQNEPNKSNKAYHWLIRVTFEEVRVNLTEQLSHLWSILSHFI